MCFSASASFVSSVVLTAAGACTLSQVTQKRQLPLAAIPLLFAIQQFSEGMVWLGLRHSSAPYYLHIASYTFLIFAQVVWPILVPISFLMMAAKEKNRIELSVLTGIGILVSGYLGWCLFNYGAFAEAHTRHIAYILHYPGHLTIIAAGLYGLATIAPPFLAGIKLGWVLGVAILVSYIITSILYTQEIISVWCFFSALMSVIIYAILTHYPTPEPRSFLSPGLQLA